MVLTMIFLSATPRSKQFDASQIPGLGTDLGPQQNRSSSPGIQDFVDAPRYCVHIIRRVIN